MTTLDPMVFGHRLRHFRRRAGLTLSQLGGTIGRPASYLSQLENGHREPRLSTVHDLAAALGCAPGDLLETGVPNRRASLELALERAQQDPRYKALRLGYLKPSARLGDDVLEHLVALFDRMCEMAEHPADTGSTGQGARAANAAMREEMRSRDNYFAEVEQIAARALEAVGHSGAGAVPERTLTDLATHFGFSIARVQDLPPSTRSITDQRRRVLYVPQRNDLPTRTARSVIMQTLGHFALGHRDPTNFAEYVRQRVESNYFAGAILAPERAVVGLLIEAKTRGDISVEDLKEVFYISYEMAAHRLTNLITRHLDIPVHFLRSDSEGVVWKAYENDGVPLPADGDGTIEGQRLCRRFGPRQAFESEDSFSLHHQYTDTPAGTFWTVTQVEVDRSTNDAVTIGTREGLARWFRGSDTVHRQVSRCPDPACCRQPPSSALNRWAGVAWPSARDRTHFASGLPFDAAPFVPFPGVDLSDVYGFLDRRDGR